MAELKTKLNDASVEEFLNSVENEKRKILIYIFLFKKKNKKLFFWYLEICYEDCDEPLQKIL